MQLTAMGDSFLSVLPMEVDHINTMISTVPPTVATTTITRPMEVGMEGTPTPMRRATEVRKRRLRHPLSQLVSILPDVRAVVAHTITMRSMLGEMVVEDHRVIITVMTIEERTGLRLKMLTVPHRLRLTTGMVTPSGLTLVAATTTNTRTLEAQTTVTPLRFL